MKKDNRGFSLVELIIVLAIMAALTGATFIGIGMISGKPAEECASKIFSNIQANRTTAMGKYSASVSFYRGTDGIYVVEEVNGTQGTPVKIGDAGVNVQYRVTGDSADAWRNLGSSSDALVISYNRSTGAFKDLEAMGLDDKYCLEIKCSKANKTKTIILYHLTGKISMD